MRLILNRVTSWYTPPPIDRMKTVLIRSLRIFWVRPSPSPSRRDELVLPPPTHGDELTASGVHAAQSGYGGVGVRVKGQASSTPHPLSRLVYVAFGVMSFGLMSHSALCRIRHYVTIRDMSHSALCRIRHYVALVHSQSKTVRGL